MHLSPYILIIVVSWIAAQGVKYLFQAVRERSFVNLRPLYLSGDMPSAHSATVAALATMVGLLDGFSTAIFGVAALLAGIVMYDAMMVRRSSGEQGEALRRLLVDQKSTIPLPRAAKGHRPLEVAAGAGLGIVIALVVFFALQ